MMSELKRYHIPLAGGAYVALADEAYEDLTGYWCKYEDHKAKIKKLESQIPIWVSVEDKLPKKEGVYLCYSNDGYDVLPYDFDEGFYDEDEEWPHLPVNDVITHWMPLPSAPTGEGEI